MRSTREVRWPFVAAGEGDAWAVSVDACADDAREIDAVLGRDLAGQRRGAGVLASAIGRRKCWLVWSGRRSRCGGGPGLARSRSLSLLGLGGSGCGGSTFGLAGGLVDACDGRADLDGVALSELLIAQDARRRGRDLHSDLVGLEFEERFVLIDPIAGLFQPGSDHAFGDRFAHVRNDDFNCHIRALRF